MYVVLMGVGDKGEREQDEVRESNKKRGHFFKFQARYYALH